MSGSSRRLDRFATTFDHEGPVANAGLIVAGTLMARLGLLGLIERWVRTGSANPGRKILTVVAAMVEGATHIDHVEMLRAGAHRAGAGVQADGTHNARGQFCGKSDVDGPLPAHIFTVSWRLCSLRGWSDAMKWEMSSRIA